MIIIVGRFVVTFFTRASSASSTSFRRARTHTPAAAVLPFNGTITEQHPGD